MTVAIAATNPETLDGLSSYLRGVGVGVRCMRDPSECAGFASASKTRVAVVIFPDDFRWEKVVATLADLASLRPTVLPVLVTAYPQRFETVRAAEEVIIMPRPVWGWTILDAIRAQVARQESIRRAKAPW